MVRGRVYRVWGAVKSPFRRGEDLNPVDSSFKGVRPDLVSMAAFFSLSGLVVCGPAPCVVGAFVPFLGFFTARVWWASFLGFS